jgi:predicted permease
VGTFTIEGRPQAEGAGFVNVDRRIIAGGYLEAMQIPIVEGRQFTPQDVRAQPRVVLVDQRMAEQIWPGQSAIGKRLRTGGLDANPDAPWLTVVGVVGRIKQDTLDADSRMALYLAHAQTPTRSMNFVVRSAEEPRALTAAVRRTVAAFDPDLPMYRVQMMSDRVDSSLAERRFSMCLLTLFAATALALAAIGSYGVMACVVSQGTRELGIRIALGATPPGILALVVRQGLILTIAGASIGLAASLVLTRSMRGMLFEVSRSDPMTYLGITSLLVLVSLTASAVPARRASRTDPMKSLREE